MLLLARALKVQGTAIPQIVAKLTIKTRQERREAPSVASLYRALADTDARQPAGPP